MPRAFAPGVGINATASKHLPGLSQKTSLSLLSTVLPNQPGLTVVQGLQLIKRQTCCLQGT